MRLVHIETLIVLAECSSIRAAAARLGKSQPVITARLREMEADIGFPLFVRTTRGITPTETAMTVLARARSVEAERERLEQEIAGLRGKQTGNIRVCVTPLVAIKIMPRAIARFQKSFPDVGVTLSADIESHALQLLRDRHCDIIIGPNPQAAQASDLVCEELFKTDITIITKKNSPYAAATSLSALADCDWVSLWNSPLGPGKQFLNHFTEAGLPPPRIRASSESQLGILALVEELGAVSTFPVRLLEEVGQNRGVVRVAIKEPIKPLSISMVTRAGRSLTPAGDALADCIRHRVGNLLNEWKTTGS